jgi:hypothetical protein
MKVLDLRCTHGHEFEGWFASEEEVQLQISQGLLTCPLCGDATITRMLSAPHLNLRSNSQAQPNNEKPGASAKSDVSVPNAASGADVPQVPVKALQAAWINVVRHVLAHTEDVGERFAEEARRMHYGDAPERNIRGRSTFEEAQELISEGIVVTALPIPDGIDEPLH